ncbi:G-type lectin S-receptor-like serine/threonine-protein kinase RKS1 [Camellia sinensis]|uniref:G-type lectin S-receptor-like serine/threonine-protein kinase RKS1 n=1 Tax=Camellia sinensis TaxID=4442 RepID=UPI001035C8CE|nr:G-type lectin S-receptor-like serine/threonine-protein kinase RKS1 [Camellia sinensis]
MDTRVFSNGGSDLYVGVDAVELAQQYSKKPRSLHGKVVAIVVTSIVVMSLLIMIPLVCWLVIRKRRRGDDIQISDEEKVELSIFDMVTISKATNKFCDANKIGEGAFGPVYKVSLFHSYTSYFSGQMKSFTRKTYYNLSHDDQTKSLYCLS